MGLVAGPVLVGIDPGFAPGPLLVAGQVVAVRHMVMEREHVDRAALRRCFTGMPAGLIAALIVLSLVSDRTLAFLIGGFTALAAVALLTGVRVRRTAGVDVGAGFAVALAGVTAGLPGPPIVVAFDDMAPKVMRATASTYILAVAVVGIIGLALTGEFGVREVGLTAQLLPGVAIGLVLARHLRPLLDRAWFRPVVLLVALAGAVALILRQVT